MGSDCARPPVPEPLLEPPVAPPVIQTEHNASVFNYPYHHDFVEINVEMIVSDIKRAKYTCQSFTAKKKKVESLKAK